MDYKIVLLGNPSLRQVSEPIKETEFGTKALKDFAIQLFEIMERENGLGLAAPQIGINKRAMVFGMKTHPRYKDLPEIPYTVLFNPSFVPLSDDQVSDYEGCLSVGPLRAKVSRYQSICYKGYDIEGNLIERVVTDLHARVFQHELDHLDGIVFVDRVTDHGSMGFQDELMRFGLLGAGSID